MKLPTVTEIEEMKLFFNIIPKNVNLESFFEPIENNALIHSRPFYDQTLNLFRTIRESVLENLTYAKDTEPIINYCLFKSESYKKPFLKKSNPKIKLFFKTILELENLDTIDGEFGDLSKSIAVSISHFLNPLISIRRLQTATRNYLNYFYLNLESERIVEGHKILFVDKPFLFTPWTKSGISPAHSSPHNNTILIGKVPKNLIEVIIEHEIIEILTESHTEGVRAEEKKALELGVMQDLIKYRKKLEKLGITIT